MIASKNVLKVNSPETRWLLLPPGRAIRGIYTLVTTRRHDHTAECYTCSDANSPTWNLNKSQMWPTQQTTAFREERFEQKRERTVTANVHFKVFTICWKWTFLVVQNASVQFSSILQTCTVTDGTWFSQSQWANQTKRSNFPLFYSFLLLSHYGCITLLHMWTEPIRQTGLNRISGSTCHTNMQIIPQQAACVASPFPHSEGKRKCCHHYLYKWRQT